MPATLIKNARIVAGPDLLHGDLLIENETIARLDPHIPQGNAKIIDAKGKYLLPGGVDVHTHFDLDLGAFKANDSWYTGSVAAACGGTTTVVDHVGNGPAGCPLDYQIEVYHKLARPAVIDYSFHGVIQHVDHQVLADMEKLIDAGITSHKIYTTYGNKQEDPEILRVLERARDLGTVICVHCENDAIVKFLTKRLLDKGHKSPSGHPLARPACCEAEAVDRLIMLAKAAGEAPLYIVHLSAALSLEAVRAARRRGQKNLYAETCPQYLFLDDSRYADPAEGLKYIMSPPLRTPADNMILWEGLRRGDFDAVATDHCPFCFKKDKQAGKDDFSKTPGGAPGVELRLALLLSEGFLNGRLSLPEVVRYASTRPAEVFGLYPKKGVIQPGSDADLVLFDPDPALDRDIDHAQLHENVDYTPYQGMRQRGRIVMTLSRGEVIVENSRCLAAEGRGKFVKRGLGGGR